MTDEKALLVMIALYEEHGIDLRVEEIKKKVSKFLTDEEANTFPSWRIAKAIKSSSH